MKNYRVLIDRQAYDKTSEYLALLKAGNPAGEYLQGRLKQVELDRLNEIELLELLLRTKRPKIFAEFEIYGNGIDWNRSELSILGDISIVTPVTVYDNGKHRQPDIHDRPFTATLIFTPGALLRNGHGVTPGDLDEITDNGGFSFDRYYRLYERRLLPGLFEANESAKAKNKRALITIPGMGCGQFAGTFRGKLGMELKRVLVKLLQQHGSKLSHLMAVYYDPYSECENDRLEIEGISLLVRPLLQGNGHKPQLCPPPTYAEAGDNFDDCELFSFVAWDHVSFPGNDFYVGSRSTDDGVKAAATDAIAMITGIEGEYDPQYYKYLPPAEYTDWKEVVIKNKIQLKAIDRLVIRS
jgi:hypothetical protein